MISFCNLEISQWHFLGEDAVRGYLYHMLVYHSTIIQCPTNETVEIGLPGVAEMTNPWSASRLSGYPGNSNYKPACERNTSVILSGSVVHVESNTLIVPFRSERWTIITLCEWFVGRPSCHRYTPFNCIPPSKHKAMAKISNRDTE